MNSEINISKVKPGSTGAGGWDCDVTVTLNGAKVEGEITLLPDSSGNPSRWGSLDHWMTHNLIVAFGDDRGALHEIEEAASDAIKRSRVSASEPTRG